MSRPDHPDLARPAPSVAEASLTGVTVGLVLFNPKEDHHLGIIRAASAVGCEVVVYDNSTSPILCAQNRVSCLAAGSGCHFLGGDGNVGLSSALNRIVELVRSRQHDGTLILFDQDSTVTPSLLRDLDDRRRRAERGGVVGVLAPLVVRESGAEYGLRYLPSLPGFSLPLRPVRFVPTSGSVIPLRTFQVVGTFQEDFFIDHIDLDFCDRCWQYALPVLVDTSLQMPHRIGEGDVRIGGRALVPISAPFRHYYQCRNMVLSALRSNLSRSLLVRTILVKLASIAVTAAFAGDVASRLRFMLQGYWDGFRNVGGSYADRHAAKTRP